MNKLAFFNIKKQLFCFTAVCILFSSFFLIFSCASIPKPLKELSGIELLPDNASMYARLDAKTFKNILAYNKKELSEITDEFSKRTSDIFLAVFENSENTETDFLAVAEGKYPVQIIKMKMNTDKAFKKAGSQYIYTDTKGKHWYLSFIADKQVLLSNKTLEPVLSIHNQALAKSKSPNIENYLIEPVSIFFSKPLSFISDYVPINAETVPLKSLLFSAKQRENDVYYSSLVFEFDSPASARIFSPLCRVFLYAVANMLWPERAATILDSTSWAIEKNYVNADGIELSDKSILSFGSYFFNF